MNTAMLVNPFDLEAIKREPDVVMRKPEGGLLGFACGSFGGIAIYVDEGAKKQVILVGDEVKIRRIVRRLRRARERRSQ